MYNKTIKMLLYWINYLITYFMPYKLIIMDNQIQYK